MRISEFGAFASVLLAVALGLAGFCGSCFAAIMTLLLYNHVGGHTVDLADSYKYVALPVGVATLVVSGAVLALLRVRRLVRE